MIKPLHLLFITLSCASAIACAKNGKGKSPARLVLPDAGAHAPHAVGEGDHHAVHVDASEVPQAFTSEGGSNGSQGPNDFNNLSSTGSNPSNNGNDKMQKDPNNVTINDLINVYGSHSGDGLINEIDAVGKHIGGAAKGNGEDGKIGGGDIEKYFGWQQRNGPGVRRPDRFHLLC